jgi:hypothetical protein
LLFRLVLSGSLQLLKRCLLLMLKFLRQNGQYCIVINFFLLFKSSGVGSSSAASLSRNLSPGMSFSKDVGARA